MIQSMTGYGKCSATYQDKKITAEIRSLNSKSLDLSIRLSPIYREKEMELRNLISNALGRGKIEFSLWIEQAGNETECPLNAALLGKYYRQIINICQQEKIPEPTNPWLTLLRLPDVLSRQDMQQELSPEEWSVANDVAEQAIQQLLEFRQQEGLALQRKFEEKLDNIAALMKSIEPYEQQRTEKIRQRLTEALQNLPNVEYDRNRLEQELIYYIEKLDISEEKQRLTNHLAYFRQTMIEEKGQGKKLSFIAQEMGREINTTGSKSNQAEMQNIVVRMKDELEQIKEQVLNVM